MNINKLDISIVKWIQNNLRNGVFDFLMKMITHLGDLYVFILIVMVIFWTVNKRFAYQFAISFIASAAVNTVLKNLFMRLRPFNEEGIVSVSSETHGSSLPSGHAQASGVTYYSLNNEYGNKNRIVKIYAYFVLIMVPISRMYLGQHYLTDVLAGLAIGILVTIGMFKLFDLMGEKEHVYPLFVIPIFIILMIFLHKNGYDNAKDLFVAGGGYIGFTLGYATEKLYIKHDVNTTLRNKILKVILGLVMVFAIYLALKFIFPSNSLVFDSIRYMAVGLSASALAPFVFKKIFKN